MTKTGDLTAKYRAIAEGYFDDPFSVLGLHKQGKSYVLRAFAPSTERLFVEQKGKRQELIRDEDYPDIFTIKLKSTAPYMLVGQSHGNEWLFDDPYRFSPVLGEMDIYLTAEGKHRRLWTALGAHVMMHEKVKGVHFAVWAPNAGRVSLVGDFNFWDGRRHVMRRHGNGVWEIFMPGLDEGTAYKYEIRGHDGRMMPLKADPVGFGSEHPPATASVVRDLSGYKFADKRWLNKREKLNNVGAPISVYEVHLGSWRRKVDEDNRRLSYLELADELVTYAKDMGFTHLEFLPISEFPFDGSWGYQPVGMYAPTIRFGTPNEFRALVEAAHKAGLGIILDWVPAHFPTDPHGLARFDGTALYEHSDPKEGFHQDWNTLIYNYGRLEVANYLIANALYWLEEYHVDGLRVDAVASMLYRDYSRNDGEWIPNKDGGRENYEAIAFLQEMNRITYGEVNGIMTIAEESTSFPGVTKPTDVNGLGFGFKWNMGWMNDSLRYMSTDPIYRKYHHHDMTFSLHYAYSENFILPLSHDEVVHGKGSMLEKMPGTRWEKFANLRAYYGFMFGHPGKKLLFMGLEFAQDREWNHDQSLDWHLLESDEHRGVQNLVRDLNGLYTTETALYLHDSDPQGFEWLEINDSENSVYAFYRRGKTDKDVVIVVSNMTPVERVNYRVGLPFKGDYIEVLNTDAECYGGGNRGNWGEIAAEPVEWHNQAQSAALYLPPLSTIFLKPAQKPRGKQAKS